jgi:hypothetical protein
MHTITTADAMATEGRIIEDAAMHEQYVRVITPEPQPTEEMEEVRWVGGWVGGWVGWWCLAARGFAAAGWRPSLELLSAAAGSRTACRTAFLDR